MQLQKLVTTYDFQSVNVKWVWNKNSSNLVWLLTTPSAFYADNKKDRLVLGSVPLRCVSTADLMLLDSPVQQTLFFHT